MVYVLIMAGGIGSRFWPKSRAKKPKQFLNFFDDQSLLQTTVNRIRPMVPVERIIISTNADYVGLVKEQIPDLPDENIIGEPVAKNTAPCIGFAAALIHQKDPDATMVVLPSDHYIRNEKAYLDDLKTCIRFTDQMGMLVTIGITPTRPETGYGYIQYIQEEKETINGEFAYPVKTFAEKPDLQTALKFLQSGDFLWNSGMFIWKTERILKEINEHLPILSQQVATFSKQLENSGGIIDKTTMDAVYQSCFSVSIDYGIMEKSKNVMVVPSKFDWSDLGSWMAIYERQKSQSDKDGNILQAENTLSIHSQNCYINSENKKLIALVDLIGIGVIETDDAILICKLDSSEDVKQVYDQLPDEKYR